MTLNIIPPNPDIVFIALNPTKDAIKNGAVFSRDKAFWNILVKSGILAESLNEVPLIDRARVVCSEGKHLTNWNIGIADLLPHVIETNSKNVKIPNGSATELFDSEPNLQNAKKIVLLGKNVTEGFRRDFPQLESWDSLSNSTGIKDFGSIGTIEMNGNKIKVYSMPFPVNNNIPAKHDIYKGIISEQL
jgi:hypothetical protein